MRRLAPLLAAAGLAACLAVPGALDVDNLARPQQITGELFPPLDAGSNEQGSLHFLVRAYGSGKAMQAADLAEAAYQRIMVDTGLTSFRPLGGLYKIVLYASADEYHKKTGQPAWSSGLSVGNSIYSYEGAHLEAVISHEMTHLIFYEYMGRSEIELRWINEGLAVYEESKAGQPSSGGAAPPLPAWPQGWVPLPLDNVIHMVPASERERTVSAWYLQAHSMVRFMIERGGRIGFGQFLGALRQGSSVDKAVADGFSTWRDLADLYAAWVKAQ
ncbi:MAG: hypothetical protein HY926_10850 [Elusimicrobia bacterium]|nr:hypothetical protein [Elusimicrobiota bacterium]